MVSLPDEAIEEFREIFKKEYNKEYTFEEAKEAAENFISFFELLHEIDMREGVTEFAKKAKRVNNEAQKLAKSQDPYKY